MIGSFKSLFGAPSLSTARRRPPGRFIPTLESLQERLVPAIVTLPTTIPTVTLTQVAPAEPTVGLVNGDIYINGTDGADTVEVSFANGKYQVKVTSTKSGPDPDGVLGDTFSTIWRIQADKVTGGDVFFNAYAGNDSFRESESTMPAAKALRVTAFGGTGNDTLVGGAKNDKLDGGDGNDDLNGGKGDDTINGQNGVDFIRGWTGNDVLNGGNDGDSAIGDSGNDFIVLGTDSAVNFAYGGAGDDTIYGSYGEDYLRGEDGNDYIDGQYGKDDILGGNGNDMLLAGSDFNYNLLDGGEGNDTLYGGNGGDSLFGRKGNDILYGLAGNDAMDGGKGYDHLYGGEGDDELDGGGDDNHQDVIYGEAGADTFHEEFKTTPDHWYTVDYHPPSGSEVQDFNADEGDTTLKI